MRLRFWRAILIFVQGRHQRALIDHQQRQDLETAMRAFSDQWEPARHERDQVLKLVERK
jgi:hypothetical protein